jgi:di/tricarboxylate transporter
MAFITPLGHAVNTLVMSPGGYNFRDYMKVGLPLTVILFAVVMLVLPVFWTL